MGPGTTREHPGLRLPGSNGVCKAERERQRGRETETDRQRERERHRTEMLAKMIKREQINNL